MPANDKRVVEVVKRSGFDKSFRNTLTSKCGTLTPILFDEWMPNTIARLGINIAASLPPLVSDTYMNVRLRIEAFACPHRLTQANFEDFYSDYQTEYYNNNSGLIERNNKGCMPLINIHEATSSFDALISPWRAKSTLLDYLGCRAAPANATYSIVAAIPAVYHLIWQEWFRNPRVQNPAFCKTLGFGTRIGNVAVRAAELIHCSYIFGSAGEQPSIYVYDSSGTPSNSLYILADGFNILSLRQRNFPLDFFTSAMVTPLQGDMPYVTVPSSDMPSGVTGFTIAALRAMNSLAQFRERNNLTSPRYQQQIYARTGTAPSDGVIQRPILIGAASYDVYSHGVVATANNDSSTVGGSPFAGSLGQRAGNGFASGSDLLVDNFHAKEPMYFMVLASLVPEVSYSQCLNPVVLRYKGIGSISDMADPILQNVGPEPIILGQIYGQPALLNDFNSVFAYTDRYSTWMFKQNEVHGEFNAVLSGSLRNFVLQRNFATDPAFGSQFLEIPTDYLDDVMAFDTSTIGLTYWMDIAFDYKVSMPLQQYCIPSLQNPAYEHGKKIVLRKNGQLL